jgi:hypothetical protein
MGHPSETWAAFTGRGFLDADSSQRCDKDRNAHSDETPKTDGDDAFNPPHSGRAFGRVLRSSVNTVNS